MQKVDNRDQWISFRVGAEHYAQPIDTIKEVIPYDPPVTVPGSPGEVEGLLNVRGEVLTVLSGHHLLDEQAQVPEEERRVMIIDTPSGRMGVSVDAVDEIVRLPPDTIEHPQQNGSDLIVGTAQKGERLYILVDLDGHYHNQAVKEDKEH